MRRTFQLTHPKIKYPRLIEAAKHEIRKYVKRERRRPLPKGTDFWDFDCRFGPTEAESESVHLAELSKRIDEAEEQQASAFFVAVVARAATRHSRAASVESVPHETT